MREKMIVCGALACLVACKGGANGEEDPAPAWWSLQVTPENPMGGEWQDEDGRCLFTGIDRIEWDGKEIECEWVAYELTYTCVTSFAHGYSGPTMVPVDPVPGYLGDVRFWDEDVWEHYLEPGCQ